MFHYGEGYESYVAELDGAAFLCEEPSEECEEMAKTLAVRCKKRMMALAEFMLDELDGIYGNLEVETFIERLGKPQIDLERGCVAFLEHDFDDHILEVEYRGELEEFLSLTMDG